MSKARVIFFPYRLSFPPTPHSDPQDKFSHPLGTKPRFYRTPFTLPPVDQTPHLRIPPSQSPGPATAPAPCPPSGSSAAAVTSLLLHSLTHPQNSRSPLETEVPTPLSQGTPRLLGTTFATPWADSTLASVPDSLFLEQLHTFSCLCLCLTMPLPLPVPQAEMPPTALPSRGFIFSLPKPLSGSLP